MRSAACRRAAHPAGRACGGASCSQAEARGCRAPDQRAACGKHGPSRGARAELRAARHDAVGDSGSEDGKAQQRQRGECNRHDLVDVGFDAEARAGELAEQRGADAGDDGQDQHFDVS